MISRPSADDLKPLQVSDMWEFRQTKWMQDAVGSGVERLEVKDPGTSIEIPDGKAVLWRYMDLAKLLALVSNRTLFFTALDKLGDRFEGRWPDRTFELIRERDELWTSDRGDHVVVEDKRQDQCLEFPREDPSWSVEETINHWFTTLRRGAARRSTFVNCWYQEAEESEAMWKLFASQPYGVAVRSTAARLVGSFTEQLPDYLGRVAYIAYDKDLMPVTEFPPVFFKRRAFMHEREVRAVVAPQHRAEKTEVENGPAGVEYKIDPERLIEAVVISPYSPDWLLDVVRSTLGRFEIDAPVEKSVLERRPTGEGTWLRVRNLKAYFAFRDRELPLRVWATSRAHAFEAARKRWQPKADDEQIEVWTEAECDDGYRERPNQYERVASLHNNEFQNSLDPEQS